MKSIAVYRKAFQDVCDQGGCAIKSIFFNKYKNILYVNKSKLDFLNEKESVVSEMLTYNPTQHSFSQNSQSLQNILVHTMLYSPSFEYSISIHNNSFHLYKNNTFLFESSYAQIHSLVYLFGHFSGTSWNQEENMFLYTTEPLIESRNSMLSINSDYSIHYDYQSWGEGYDSTFIPSLYIAEIDQINKNINYHKLKNMPILSYGQSFFVNSYNSSSSSSINSLLTNQECSNNKNKKDQTITICTLGFNHNNNYGIMHCYQRLSSLYMIKLNNLFEMISMKQISSDDEIAYSPRLSPNNQYIVYLSKPKNVYINESSWMLKLYDIQKQITTTLLPLIEDPKSNEFPGLFCLDLPPNPWSDDNETLYINTVNRSKISTLCIHIHDKENYFIFHNDEEACIEYLACIHDSILAKYSTPKSPYKLLLINSKTQEIYQQLYTYIDTTIISNSINENISYYPKLSLPYSISNMIFKILTIPSLKYNQTLKSNSTFESTIMIPAIDKSQYSNYNKHLQLTHKIPLLIWLHGGPHRSFPINYDFVTNYYISLGYAIVLVNYRGSFGYGEGNIHSLSGKIGEQDVEDILSTIRYIKQQSYEQDSIFKNLDVNCIYVQGASHGGFIAAHLIGQYPEMFRCAFLRNPATNFVNMIGITDMSDWCLVESGCSITRGYNVTSEGKIETIQDLNTERKQKAIDIQNHQYIYTKEDLEIMYKVSPYQYASKVKCGVVIALGGKDRRVPMNIGHEYIQNVKQHNKDVITLFYPNDNHTLRSMTATLDGYSIFAQFMDEHP